MRARVRRATVRVLLLDDQERMLLFLDSDPGVPGSSWWITPGGGIDPDESELEAVVRELAEETGLDVEVEVIRGPVARRNVLHGYSDQVVVQKDAFYVVRVPAFDVDTSGHTAEEQTTMLGSRWWTRGELATTLDEIRPVGLLGLWEACEDVESWPLALTEVEESSVPASPQRGWSAQGRT